MKPLSIDIIAYAPTQFFHCQHCEIAWEQTGIAQRTHAEQLANNLPDDIMRDYQHLSDWIIALVDKHCGRLAVHVIDAASVEGFLKSLCHGVRHYPTAILDGGEKIPLSDLAGAEAAIERQLAATAAVAS